MRRVSLWLLRAAAVVFQLHAMSRRLLVRIDHRRALHLRGWILRTGGQHWVHALLQRILLGVAGQRVMHAVPSRQLVRERGGGAGALPIGLLLAWRHHLVHAMPRRVRVRISVGRAGALSCRDVRQRRLVSLRLVPGRQRMPRARGGASRLRPGQLLNGGPARVHAVPDRHVR